MDIYSVLSSKSHNLHYLIRYVKFIQACLEKNVGYNGPIENHHICPRAKDMFPEYEDFRLHPWNKAPLTPRQHFIAHLMLWKTFPLFNSQTHAAWSMKWKNGMKINSRIYESLKSDFRKLASEMQKGKVVVKDDDENIYKVSVDDTRYLSGELVGIQKGMSWKIEDTTNYKKPKSKSHIENMKKWASVTDPITMERKRVLRTDLLYVSGYYKGPSYGIQKTEERNI